MKQVKKGVDARSKEAKSAFRFCDSIKKDINLKNYEIGEISIMFDKWIIENDYNDINLSLTEEIVYKILGSNGYEKFFFAIEETKKERFKSEIKYSVIKNDKLHELTMVAYLKNSLDTHEATELIKKHYSDLLYFGGLNIFEACNSLVSETRENIHQATRDKLVNDFYGYDESSIKVLEINGLETKDIESIQHKVTINILKDRIKKHLQNN